MNGAGDAVGLEAALRALAGDVSVEARDRLAVVRPGAAGYAAVVRHRVAIVAAARAHGFTHACVEVGSP